MVRGFESHRLSIAVDGETDLNRRKRAAARIAKEVTNETDAQQHSWIVLKT